MRNAACCGLGCGLMLCGLSAWPSLAYAQQSTKPAVAAPAIVPPKLLTAPAPVYPPSRIAGGTHPTVTVQVVLNETGKVVKADVEHSAGSDFDKAALNAVRTWTFSPARRDGQAVASRLHVAVHFELPTYDLTTTQAGASAVLRGSHPPVHVMPEADSGVTGKRIGFRTTAQVEQTELRASHRSSGDVSIKHDVLQAAPRSEGAELLRSVPGVYIARPEGEAVSHTIMMRGFDAEHGQDVEMRLGHVPLNLPSHLHGQGYTDLGFLIPEVVQDLSVTAGVSDPRQGDFAVAGSFDFKLGVPERGIHIKSGYGSFDTFRQLLVWAPPGEAQETFGAVQYRSTDGFGQNRAGQSGSGIVQGAFGTGQWRYKALGIAYGARADMAGVVRYDDVEAGTVGFYDVYPFPTAQAQNAAAARVLGGFSAEYRGDSGDNGDMGVWLGHDTFRVQENFTGFAEHADDPEHANVGDLLGQDNRTMSMGMSGRYRTAAYKPASWAQGTVELGVSGRFDTIDQAQADLDAANGNQVIEQSVDAQIRSLDLGMWGDLAWELGPLLILRAGLRADALYYQVNDQITEPHDDAADADHVQGYGRSAAGLAWGPRASAEVKMSPWLSLLGAYGEGFRSPQGRQLQDGDDVTFTKVRSADIGVRMRSDNRYELSLTGFYTGLSEDLLFDAHEGRLERIGPTRRLGTVAYGVVRPVSWVRAAASVTYADARLLEDGEDEGDGAGLSNEAGDRVPFVPPLVLRLDAAVQGVVLKSVAHHPLGGRLGLGWSFLSARPLPYDGSASPFSLLDTVAGVTWRNMEFAVEIFNLLDARYGASEFNFVSQWDPNGPATNAPARHVAAGAPRTVMATLGLRL
jgi:iron complex outermembrane receptor protein